MEDLTGRQMGQYRIVAPLGEGGMAAVYKAYQASMDRYVALKILPSHFASDPNFQYRFEREAKLIANLEHPNILPVYDFGQDGGFSYIVMRFVTGGCLSDLLKGQLLPLPQVTGIISKVASALDYAHSHGVVHRDVKPSNVLIDEQGNCLLSDFGLAKVILSDSRFTVSGAFIGTPSYASPEQCLGQELDHRSDVYSLGVILYEMVTGRTPFNAETPMAIVVKTIHDPLPPPRTINPSLSKEVERVILKALAKEPADRYQSAGDLARALEAATGGVPAGPLAILPQAVPQAGAPRPPATPASAGRKIPVWGWIAGCAGLFMLMGLVAIGIVLVLSFARPSSNRALPSPTIRPTKTQSMLAAVPELPTETAFEATAASFAPTLAAVIDTPAMALEPTQTEMRLVTATNIPTPRPTVTLVPYTPAPAGSWKALDDLPRTINAVVWDPANPQVVYVGTGDYAGSGAGVFKSEDGGLSWHPASAGLPFKSVVAMTLLPGDKPVLYALTSDVVLTSVDGAQTWTFRGNIQGFSGPGPFRIFPSADGRVLFATVGSDLPQRSEDGGQTWVPFGTGLPAGNSGSGSATILAVDPGNAQVIYAGTDASGVYKSTDGGWNFSASNQGMLDYGIMSLTVDPVDPQIVYAGGSNGELFKSTDGGKNWNNLTDRLPVQENRSIGTVRAIFLTPAQDGSLYLFADTAGLMVSHDSGESWQLLGSPPGQDYSSFTSVGITTDPQLILITSSQRGGGWRYSFGENQTALASTPAPAVTAVAGPFFPPGAWQEVTGLPRAINSIAFDPQDPMLAYACTGSIGQGGTVYKTSDGGLTWQQSANGLGTNGISAITIAGDGRLYAFGSSGEIYSSSDHAGTWTLKGSTGTYVPFGGWLIVAPSNPDILYNIISPSGFGRSTDGGRTWVAIQNGLPQGDNEVYVLSLAIDPSDAQIVYAGTGGFVGQGFGVYKSTDGGDTWQPSNQKMLDYSITALAIDPADPQVIYAGGDSGELFKSVDGGKTWNNLSMNLYGQSNTPGGKITAIEIDPSDSGRVFLVGGKGLMYTLDGGNTWQQFSEPGGQSQTGYTAWAVRFGDQPALIIAAGNDGGVWIFTIK